MEGKGAMQRGGRGGSNGGGRQGNGEMEGRGCRWWALVVGGWGVIMSMGAHHSSVGDRHCPWVGASPLSLGVIVLVVIVVVFILIVVLAVIVLVVVVVVLVVVVVWLSW